MLQCSVCDQETILTKLLPLLANEYTSIPAECQGKLTKYMGKKTWSGFAFCLGRVFVVFFFCPGEGTKIFLGLCDIKTPDKLWKC